MTKNYSKTKLFLLMAFSFCISANANTYTFTSTYSKNNEPGVIISSGTGTITGTYNDVTNTVVFTINFSGLSSNTVAAHFHGSATSFATVNAPVLYPHVGFPTGVVTLETYSSSVVISEAHEAFLFSGTMYSNIHTVNYPGGEIRAQIRLSTINCPANITAFNDQGLCTASKTFIATAIGAPTPAVTYAIGSTPITSPYAFPVGITTVTATATNTGGTASCTFTVTVTDNEAPVISQPVATPNKLWPPNHKMKDVSVAYTATDNCGQPITCSLTVSSNEAVNDKGDGNTSPDWIVNPNDAHNLQLRAERSGKGNGRIYTITTTCTDQYLNSSSKTSTVTVPHDNRSSASIAGLRLGIMNNPSRNHFTLNVQTENNRDKLTIRVFDMHGRMLESKANLQGSQLVKIGSDLKPGFYVVELTQGKQKAQLKLVKSK